MPPFHMKLIPAVKLLSLIWKYLYCNTYLKEKLTNAGLFSSNFNANLNYIKLNLTLRNCSAYSFH